LYTHDVKADKSNYALMGFLAQELLEKEKTDEAQYYAEQSVSLHPTVYNLNTLGLIYQHKKQYNKAISTYERTIPLIRVLPNWAKDKESEYAFINLTAILLNKNKPLDAIWFINNQYLRLFPQSSSLYLLLAIAESMIGNHEIAFEAISKAYQMDPQSKITKSLFERIQSNQPINLNLGY